MKNLFIILPFVLLLLVLGCTADKEGETEEMQNSSPETSGTTPAGLPDLSDNYLVGIYEAQELVKIFKDEKSFREDYCKRAYLEKYDLFISMGIGRLTNPETGQPIPLHLVRRAADLDARRWASYGEQWLSADYEPPFGELKAGFNKPVTPLKENIVGDSLFIFIATRMGRP